MQPPAQVVNTIPKTSKAAGTRGKKMAGEELKEGDSDDSGHNDLDEHVWDYEQDIRNREHQAQAKAFSEIGRNRSLLGDVHLKKTMDLLKKPDDLERELDFGTELSNIHLEQIKGENKVFSVYSIEKDHQMLKLQNKETKHEDSGKPKNIANHYKSKTAETLPGLDQPENRAGSLKRPRDNTKPLTQNVKKTQKQVSPSAKAARSEKAETKKPKKDKQRREAKSEKNQKVTRLKKNFQEDQYI